MKEDSQSETTENNWKASYVILAGGFNWSRCNLWGTCLHFLQCQKHSPYSNHILILHSQLISFY